MSANRPKLISIVVPVLNEQDTIAPFLNRTVPILDSIVQAAGPVSGYEILFVDDDSTDATLAALAAARQANDRIRVVVLSRNFGKDAALAAGLRHARGDAVIPIDVDFQDPPELIPDLVAEWIAGAQIVNTAQVDRSQDERLKRLTAAAFYTAYNKLAERPIIPNAGDFRLLDREVVSILDQLPERARFTKGLLSWIGFQSAVVPYVREKRTNGLTKWTYWRLWNFALDGISASTTTPLRIWTYCGMVIAALAFLYAAFILVLTLVFGRDTPGYASLMIVVLFVGGLNLLSLGILGEYIGRIFNEVKGRPLYIVRSTAGFETDAAEHASPEFN